MLRDGNTDEDSWIDCIQMQVSLQRLTTVLKSLTCPVCCSCRYPSEWQCVAQKVTLICIKKIVCQFDINTSILSFVGGTQDNEFLSFRRWSQICIHIFDVCLSIFGISCFTAFSHIQSLEPLIHFITYSICSAYFSLICYCHDFHFRWLSPTGKGETRGTVSSPMNLGTSLWKTASGTGIQEKGDQCPSRILHSWFLPKFEVGSQARAHFWTWQGMTNSGNQCKDQRCWHALTIEQQFNLYMYKVSSINVLLQFGIGGITTPLDHCILFVLLWVHL